MKRSALLVIATVFLGFTGCSTVPEKLSTVSVSAFAQAGASELRKFEIVRSPRNRAQPEFEEIAGTLQARLIDAGYVPVTHAEAELTIFVNYVNDESWELLPVSTPDINMFGGYNNQAGNSSMDPNTPPAAMAMMYRPPRLTDTGTRIQQPPAVVSMVMVGIQAVPTAYYRQLEARPKEEWTKAPVSAAWEIHAWYAGQEAIDKLRRALEIVKLIVPYFAKNTKGTENLSLVPSGRSS